MGQGRIIYRFYLIGDAKGAGIITSKTETTPNTMPKHSRTDTVASAKKTADTAKAMPANTNRRDVIYAAKQPPKESAEEVFISG